MTAKISVTQLSMYFTCPKQWYLAYVLKVKPATIFALTFGAEVHFFVANYIHKPLADGSRPFFYKSKDTAVKAWRRFWLVRWNTGVGKKHEAAVNLMWKGLNDGAVCIKNYYELMHEKSVPEHIEQHVELFLPDIDTKLIGVVDQVRKSKNPGKFVGIDLKTGSNPYWDDQVSEAINRQKQTSLINNVQASAYYLLIKKLMGEYLETFCFVMLGPKTAGKKVQVHQTTRSEEDLDEFKATLQHMAYEVSTKTDTEEFPKTANTRTCAFCSLNSTCVKNLRLSKPQNEKDFSASAPLLSHEIDLERKNREKPQQLRFKFNVPTLGRQQKK